MKIAIIGAGNMGHVLSAKFSDKHEVVLYTSQKELAKKINPHLVVYCADTRSRYHANISLCTFTLKEAVTKADYIFITYPSFLFPKLASKLVPLLKKNQHLVFFPGGGGSEFYFYDAIKKGCTLTAFQRVHAIARIIKKGELVRESGIRNHIIVASLPRAFNVEASKILESLFNLKVISADSYLNVTLVNSNPIMHTARLYSLFRDYSIGKTYKSISLFYGEWDLATSNIAIKMDNELFKIINFLKRRGFNINLIDTFLEHYNSKNAIQLTKKIRSIISLNNLPSPTVKIGKNKFIPNLKSRYFLADFDFGLDIFIQLSKIFHINCPTMIKVSDWYHKLVKTKRVSPIPFNNCNSILAMYQ